ncbi:MAG: hypothetical protein ABJP70_10660 [Erythrobacter sp.]
MSSDPSEKRDELRAKIEASERRVAERTITDNAKEAAGVATTYVKENPMIVLGGAIAAGLVIGMMTKPGRRAAGKAASGAGKAASGAAGAASGAAKGAAKSAGKAVKSRGASFAALLADALVAYGVKMIDKAVDTDKPDASK